MQSESTVLYHVKLRTVPTKVFRKSRNKNRFSKKTYGLFSTQHAA